MTTAVQDPVFDKLINNVTKFMVFRVQKMKIAEVPELEWGRFFSGDCYLVYDGRHGGSNIFYWLGTDSSLDEQAVVAIKAVELDTLFNGLPVQHREVEGHESRAFRKLFPAGIVTMKGGHDSGLKHVTAQTHVARLFQICGGNSPILREVKLDWGSLNHGDTFVLDSGSIIFIWTGSKSSGMEKVTASQLANKLRDKVGEEIVWVMDGEEDEMTEDELELWNQHLPLENRGDVRPAVDDRRAQRVLHDQVTLYQCSDISGELKIDLVKKGNLQKDDLKEDDAFIVNAGEFGIWIWLGRRSNQNERRQAIQTGLSFLKKENLPTDTSVTKVSMGGEPEDFKTLFSSWQ